MRSGLPGHSLTYDTDSIARAALTLCSTQHHNPARKYRRPATAAQRYVDEQGGQQRPMSSIN
ncbi:MAG TPA: hypothetical protein VIQ11_19425 [Mycobacterium sp.]